MATVHTVKHYLGNKEADEWPKSFTAHLIPNLIRQKVTSFGIAQTFR